MVDIRKNAIDMTDQTYYKLTAKYPVRHSKNGLIWHFECECGNELDVLGTAVRRGNTKSCGCLNSRYELEIAQLLKSNQIDFQTQYTFEDLKIKKKLRFDFAIFKNAQLLGLIEYNGRQHYEAVSKFGGNNRLQEYKLSDQRKQEYCNINNIPLLILNKDNYSNEIIMNWINNLWVVGNSIST